jgi:hypothetical protein
VEGRQKTPAKKGTSSRDETCPVPPAIAAPTKFFVQPSSRFNFTSHPQHQTNNHAPSLFLKTGPETIPRELNSASRRRGAAIIPWPPRSPPRRVQLVQVVHQAILTAHSAGRVPAPARTSSAESCTYIVHRLLPLLGQPSSPADLEPATGLTAA